MSKAGKPWCEADASKGLLNLAEFARREGISRYYAEVAILEGRVPGAFRMATGYKIPKDAKIVERAESRP